MGQEVYVDCEGRAAERAVELLRRDVGSLRAGASTVVVRTDELETLEAVIDWVTGHGMRPSVEPRAGRSVWVRFFVLPKGFGELPACSSRELRRARGTRQRVREVEHYAV